MAKIDVETLCRVLTAPRQWVSLQAGAVVPTAPDDMALLLSGPNKKDEIGGKSTDFLGVMGTPLVRSAKDQSYHHQDRLHDALKKDAPDQRATEPKPGRNAQVVSTPRLGGLHHRYGWSEAA
jgi:hypothetical protein